MICFFFRRLNDIDQIAPIVFEYSRSNKNVHYICTNKDLDFKSNKIIKFLKKNNVNVNHMYSLVLKKYQILLLDFIFFFKKYLHKKIFFFFLKISNRFDESIGKKHYKKFLKKNNISTLVFDYPIKFNKTFDIFVSLKKSEKLSIIGIEHGILIYKNLFNYRSAETVENIKNFDKIIVPNELSKTKLLGLGYDTSKISVSGCPRFSSTWNNVLRNQIYKEKSNNSKQEKIKIILMDHSSKYGVFENSYINLVRFLEKQTHIDFKIKPNTSNQENSAVSSNKISKNLITNLDSIQLIDWSDIVICVNSSIIFDAILNDKIFFYPKYFHDHQIDWENDPCCVQFNNEKKFFNVLESLNKQKLSKFKKNIKKQDILERNVLLGNKNDENFIKNYIEKNLKS